MNHERELWEKRRRAREAEEEKALDIMGDATVRPLKREVPKIPVNAEESVIEPRSSASSAGKSSAETVAAVKAAAQKAAAESGTARRSRSTGARADSEKKETPERKTVAERKHVKKLASSEAALQTAAAGTGTKSGAGSTSGSGGSEVRRRLEEEAAKRKKRRRIITMIIAECIALVFIFGYAYVARQLNKIQRPEDFKISELETNELNVDTVETMKGYWTIAVFGVDARNNAINKGTNADVNMICNINRDTGEIKLVSVFRDTYLNISEGGTYNKLNQAYFVGGPEQAVQALNRNLDLQINDYMTFNWKAVADAINVLGGVDIELSDAEFYYINGFITETVKATGVGSKHLTHAGLNHLDGVQAVAYGRLRLMDTDFARTERQRKVIAKAFEKAKSADFKTLNTLIGTVFPQVSTSIWVDDLVANAKNISKFHLGETTGFPQARGDVNMGKKGSVVVPQTLESNVIKLHEFLYGDAEYSPSQTVKNISAKISADSGMYKEGQYVDHVSTEGVIQKPKATAAATTAADETKDSAKKTTAAETDEDGNLIESETDEDGNVITRPTAATKPGTKPTAAETDEDGNPIERETDEDGNLIEDETDEDGNPVETEEPETDEDGNPIENETLTSTKPTSATSATKPTSSTGTGVTTRPGSTTETTAGTTTSRVPGTTSSATETTSGTGVTTRPGSTTETTAGTTTSRVPGSTTAAETTSGSTTTSPGSSTGTTAGTTTTKVPGSTTSSTGTSSSNGTVSAPGAGSSTGTTTTNAPGSSSSSGTTTTTTPGTSTSIVPTAAQTTTAASTGNGVVTGPGQ